jgi:hypothetical protein
MVLQRDVERAGRKRIQQSVRAKKHLFMRRIVEEHGHDAHGRPARPPLA